MRFICEQSDFEALASLLAAKCRELSYDIAPEQSRTLAASIMGNSGYADYLLSLKRPDREDLDFFLEEGRSANQPVFREYLILGLARIGFHFPEAEYFGLALFDRLDWLPEMQLLPITASER